MTALAEREEVIVRAKFGFQMFENDGFRVCRYEYLDKPTNSPRKSFVARGKDLPNVKDVTVVLHGNWVKGREEGTYDLAVTCFETELPTEKEGVINYIASLHCGVGRSKAESLYKQYGARTWFILENQPERIQELGWSMPLIRKLCDAVQKTHLQSQILQLFNDRAVSFRQADLLAKTFGSDTMHVLRTNPYAACHVKGFSFAIIDRMAMAQGIDPTNIERRKAAALAALDAAAVVGNTGAPRSLVRKKMMALLNTAGKANVTEKQCDDALVWAISSRDVVNVKGFLYSSGRYQEERRIVQDIKRIMEAPGDSADFSKLDDIIADYERENQITLADSQKEAVKCVMENKVSILTGGPGTGKTTTTKAILHCHAALFGSKNSMPILLSPTGKAARRMEESTGYPASTIHSGLKIVMDGGSEGNEEDAQGSGSEVLGEGSLLQGNLILVDEASMADQFITCELLRNVPSGARIVFIGDPDQLPSVGCGNVLYEFIRSKAIPVVTLSVIFRQANDNPIVANSIAIKQGNTELNYQTANFVHKQRIGAQSIFESTCNMYVQCVRKYGIESTILLCPFRKSTALNVNLFNVKLQEVLNPKREGALTMKGKPLFTGQNTSVPLEFRAGDKVMMTRNTKIAMNGDTGYIKSIEKIIDPQDKTRYAVVAKVEFNGDGILHQMDAEEIRDLDLAYCTTVHKSQGSEYKIVIMAVSKLHSLMLKRNLIYTAITRAKENVLLVGEKEAIDAAILDDNIDKRFTLLGDWLHYELTVKTA